MNSSEKRKNVRERPSTKLNQEARMPEPIRRSPQDESDLQDALRARDEARREGVYPWEELRKEIEE